MLIHHAACLLHRGRWRQRDGVKNDAIRTAFDFVDFFGLRLDRHVFVDDSYATHLGECNGHRMFGHRIHRRAQHGNIEPNISGELCGEIHLSRQDLAVSRLQQDVVKSNCRLNDFIHGGSQK